MVSIQAHRQGDVLTLVFSRPETANAFGLDEAKELQKILRSNKTARLLIWRSSGGRFFCAGGDLAAYARMTKKTQGLIANKKIADALKDLSAFPGVTLAYAEGDCFGGGMELLSCFDVVWSTPHAAFGLWQRRVGLSFGWGGGQRLEARMGAGALRQKSLSSESFTAFKAYDLGLVDKIVTAERFENAFKSFCAQQLKLSMEPVMALKTRSIKSEAGWFRRLWGNKFHAKVLADFSKQKHGGRR